MDHVTKRTVVETIETAKEYISKLDNLVSSVSEAENQVSQSAARAVGDIDERFDLLHTRLTQCLHQRRKYLKEQVQEMKEDGLKPLAECQQVICAKQKRTKIFVDELEDVLKSGGLATENNERFFEEASALGTLPAVPELEFVADISVKCDVDVVLGELGAALGGLGEVWRMGPVQVTALQELPGALLVLWDEVAPDCAADGQLYRLQAAHGDARGRERLLDSSFHDAYVGPEVQSLVRGLRCDVPYSFRVCRRAEGEAGWSAWSLVKVGATRVAPFRWTPSSADYLVTNEAKLATKVSGEAALILSDAARLSHGHSIRFTAVECGEGLSEEGVGLVVSRAVASLLDKGAFFCSMEGHVYIDGARKVTRLPRLERGGSLSFALERLSESRLRVSVERGAKAVTYDWQAGPQPLHFAAALLQPGAKLLVE